MSAFTLTSPAFRDGERIPSTYTCDGSRELSPPLEIAGVPEGTKSLVLLMDDPDIPQEVKEMHKIEVFDHWVVYNIPPGTTRIPEGATLGARGLNGAGKPGYTGPCPPPHYEPREHRYIFVLYALSRGLSFDNPPTKQQVLDALQPCLIDKTQLIGRYSRA